MAVTLPALFLERMQEQLGSDFERFLEEYRKDSFCGLRVNTGRISASGFRALSSFDLRPVPWTENGFYYDPMRDDVTRHPHYFAGLYYVQEPSAMLPASRLPVEPGNLVLDLCAAPGGKSTELASRLQGKGILVANDISATRAKALVKNLSLWGASSCCVTAEPPEKLLRSFGCCFDRILVDAPCSGEGMFRRDAALAKSWEQRGPGTYAPLQKEILDCAVRMLRPGGFLLYSTCTFSEEEDEQVVCSVLEKYPELEPADLEPYYEGFAQGSSPAPKSVRIWPHRMEGEGHFLALFRRSLEDESQRDEFSGRTGALEPVSEQEIERSWRNVPAELRTFLARIPARIWRGKLFAQKNGQCHLLPPYRLPTGLRFLCTGLLLGTLKKDRFEPSQPLAMALDASSFDLVLDLPSSDSRILKYLKGETVEFAPAELRRGGRQTGPCCADSVSGPERVPAACALSPHKKEQNDGWVLVCTDGFALGWGKAADGRIKNKYNSGWRMQ